MISADFGLLPLIFITEEDTKHVEEEKKLAKANIKLANVDSKYVKAYSKLAKADSKHVEAYSKPDNVHIK